MVIYNPATPADADRARSLIRSQPKAAAAEYFRVELIRLRCVTERRVGPGAPLAVAAAELLDLCKARERQGDLVDALQQHLAQRLGRFE
jgi:hypothetical protein